MEWTLVKDKKPDCCGEYIVTTAMGEVSTCWYDEDFGFDSCFEIVAWMPFPLPCIEQSE